MTHALAYWAEVCRFYVVLALAVAAISKGRKIRPFIETLHEFLGEARIPAPVLARGIVAAEGLSAGLLALGPPASRAGMELALALLLLFTATILIALRRGRTLDCNCFGGRTHPVSAYDVARNLTLIIAAGGYLFAPSARVELAALPVLAGFAVIGVLATAHLREIAQLLVGEQGPA